MLGEKTEKAVPKTRSTGKMASAILSRGEGRKGELRRGVEDVWVPLGQADLEGVGMGAVSAPPRVLTI